MLYASISLITSSQVEVMVVEFLPPQGMPNSVKIFSIHGIFGILKAFIVTHTQSTAQSFPESNFALNSFRDANTTNAQLRMNEYEKCFML